MARVSFFFILGTLHFADAVQRRSALSGSTSTSDVGITAVSQLPDCLMAYSACLSELPCKISLDSLNRHCGSSELFCNATKLTHCLSVLRTLENRSPFRNCTCQRDSGWTAEERDSCNYYSKLVRAHPCSALRSSSVRRNKSNVAVSGRQTTTVKSHLGPAKSASGAQSPQARSVNLSKTDSNAPPLHDCYAARKACAADNQCVPLLTNFKRFCRPDSDCTDAVQGCATVAQQLAARSSLFNCSCRAPRRRKDTSTDPMPDRCESVEQKFQAPTCLKHLGFTNATLAPCANKLEGQSSGNAAACAKGGKSETSDCYDAVAQCDGDVLCRTQLAKLLSACSGGDQCDSNACRRASAEFYDTPGRRAARLVACRCDEARDRTNCEKHAAYFRPCLPLAQRSTPSTTPTTPKSTPTASSSLKTQSQSLSADKISTGYSAQERYPRDFCSQMQRYNRLSRTHRIYTYVNGSECSEVCNCSTDGSYVCRNLTCVMGTQRPTCVSGALETADRECICREGGLVCVPEGVQEGSKVRASVRPEGNASRGSPKVREEVTGQRSVKGRENPRVPKGQSGGGIGFKGGPTTQGSHKLREVQRGPKLQATREDDDGAPAPSPEMQDASGAPADSPAQENLRTDPTTPRASNGLFLHVGYSVDEQRMLESHDVRVEFDSLVQKLSQLLNGETGIRQCDLQLQTATDGSVVFEVKITGRKADAQNVTNDSSGRVCFYPAQLLSYFINLRHPSVSHDAELSMFRSASLIGTRNSSPVDESSDSDIAVEENSADSNVVVTTQNVQPFKAPANTADSNLDNDDVWLLGSERSAASRSQSRSFFSFCCTIYLFFKLAFDLLR